MINIEFSNKEKLTIPDNSPEYVRTNYNPSNITIYSTGKGDMTLSEVERVDRADNKLTFSGHFYIRTNGEIYRGRPQECVGDFAYDFNHRYNLNYDNIGICLEGNFNEDFLQDVQKSSMLLLIDYLREQYNSGIKLNFLSEFDHNDNPGKLFPFGEITAYYNQVFEINNILIGNVRFVTFGSRELLYNSLNLMEGTDVYTLQTILKKLNFFEDKPSSIYDDYTRLCVMKYQRYANLVDSGIAGFKTIERLKDDIKRIYSTKIFKRVISIEPGDEYLDGEDVLKVQKELNKKKYKCGETGVYDSETAQAVYRFQESNNIKADGKIGPITWNLLFNKSTNGNFRILKLNFNELMYGEDVKLLQERLNELGYRIPITEKFDLLTETQIRSYQLKNGLPATGIVDRELWDMIFSN